ncbi:MAG: polynucleotide adenylyltransferase [Ruminococcaceae bacterium]|nr:polynucleotide adenylyltransferase [Oscillospiraceae bacterium]
MDYPSNVSFVIDRLEALGHEAFIVGGSVRDSVMGRIPNDYDVTTSALPEQILSSFSDMRTIPTGLKHGTVTVISGGEPIEVTTYRIDGDYLDSRHPSSVIFTDSITADLSRRDFTVNAMAYSKKRGLVDPFGGEADIARRLIRAVGEPKRRFSEDALRILRAFRFASQLDFSIDGETLLGARDEACGLSRIAAERKAVELLKLITAKNPSYALFEMKRLEIFPYIFGEYQPSDRVISALDRAELSARAALSLLLFECEESARGEILRSLKLPTKLFSGCETICRRLSQGLPSGESGARRLIGSCGELIQDLLSAARALSVLDPALESAVIENLRKGSCTTAAELSVRGYDIVKLGISGKAVGETIAYLLEAVIEDPSLNKKETLLSLAAERNGIKG